MRLITILIAAGSFSMAFQPGCWAIVATSAADFGPLPSPPVLTCGFPQSR
jgi:hypothetical protein